MNKEQFERYMMQIKFNLDADRLNDALRIEENVLYTNPSWPYLDDVIGIRQAYQGLLNCMEQGFQDPSREEQYNRLITQTYQMMHKFARFYKLQDPYSLYKKSTNELQDTPMEVYVKQLEQIQLEQIMSEGDLTLQDKNEKLREECRHQLFIRIWTSGVFTVDEVKALQQLMDSALVHKHDKAVCLGALLLHEELMPDMAILELMGKIASNYNTDDELRLRALTNVAICLLTHHEEYKHSPARYKAIVKLFWNNGMKTDFMTIVHQIAMTMRSRVLLERIQQDIMPLLQGENPFGNSMEQIKKASDQIQKLIKKGVDVQYASMYHEKKHPFFKQVENWFMPFSSEHTLTAEALRDEKFATKEMKIILNNPTICDSDRWSIFFKIKEVNFPMELSGLSADEIDMVDMKPTPNSLIRNYIADLFRFYTIFAYHQEFNSLIFGPQKLPEATLSVTSSILSLPEAKLEMAARLFKTEFYEEAIALASEYIEDKDYALDANTLIGNIYLSGYKNPGKAQAYYEEALSIESSKDLKYKLAICYADQKDNERAAALFLELLEEEPENVQYMMETILSLVKSGATEQAIPILYKLSYIDEANSGDFAHGQLARCFLIQDKLEEAWAAFEQIENRSLPNLLLGGKICWAMQDYKNAIDFFKYYLKKSPDKNKAMNSLFEEDPVMEKYHLGEFELQLIWDILHKD